METSNAYQELFRLSRSHEEKDAMLQIDAMVQEGAINFQAPDFIKHYQEANPYKDLPLHLAVSNKNYQTASTLLDHGTDPTIINPKDGNTALHILIQTIILDNPIENSGYDVKQERWKLFTKFVDHFASRRKIECENVQGYTPLIFLMREYLVHGTSLSAEKEQYLCSKGAQFSFINSDGNTALHLFAFLPNTLTNFSILEKIPVNPHHFNKHGFQAIDIAKTVGSEVVTGFLQASMSKTTQSIASPPKKRHQNIEVLKFVNEKFTNTDSFIKENFLRSPSHLLFHVIQARTESFLDRVEEILEKKYAKINEKRTVNETIETIASYTLGILYCDENCLKLFSIFIKHHFDFSAPIYEDQKTFLQVLIKHYFEAPFSEKRYQNVIAILSNQKVELNINSQDKWGNTPLHTLYQLVAEMDKKDQAEFIMNRVMPLANMLITSLGAKSSIKNKEGRLPEELIAPSPNKKEASRFFKKVSIHASDSVFAQTRKNFISNLNKN